MDFKEQIKQLSIKTSDLKEQVLTEESTKMSLIVPFFQILGYDVFNPKEFCPEFTADIGIKKGEKVDYAILMNNEPVILIEAKTANKKLDKHSSQLFRYFVATKTKFAILTNGVIYKFYTDLEEQNKMDKEAFMEVDMLNLTDSMIAQIEKFKKDVLNITDILDTASILKYTTAFKKALKMQYNEPTEDFVKLFLQPIYKGPKTQSVIEKFKPILTKSFHDIMNDMVNEKIQLALDSSNRTVNDDTIVSTDEEWELLSIIKEILKNTIDGSDISFKYTESYIAVIYKKNVRKWLCRIIMNPNQKILIIPDESKKEMRFNLKNIEEIKNYAKLLLNVMNRYIDSEYAEIKNKEYIYTTYGTFEKPNPYVVDLTRRRNKKTIIK